MDDLRQGFLNGNPPVPNGDPVEVAEAYSLAGRELYWKDGNLPASRACLEAGIAFCAAQEPATEALLGIQKAMNYNLGSFCWPGWGEHDPTPGDVDAGERAARTNLDLAIQLKRGPDPMANAHWLVGAYALERGDREGATASFLRAAEVAADPGTARLGRAYAQLASRSDDFDATVEAMRHSGGEHAEFFANQLETVAARYR